jgi:hypothetical protein
MSVMQLANHALEIISNFLNQGFKHEKCNKLRQVII